MSLVVLRKERREQQLAENQRRNRFRIRKILENGSAIKLLQSCTGAALKQLEKIVPLRLTMKIILHCVQVPARHASAIILNL